MIVLEFLSKSEGDVGFCSCGLGSSARLQVFSGLNGLNVVFFGVYMLFMKRATLFNFSLLFEGS